jgi:uncharacterized protein
MNAKIALISLNLILMSNVLVAQETKNSIFWKISADTLEKPCYIFGTHHLHDYQFIEKDENVHKILQKVDMVMGEMVMDEQQLAPMIMKFSLAMMMKETTMDKLLKPEDFEATDKCLKENLGMGLTWFNNYKPIFIYQMLMMAKYMKNQQNVDSLAQVSKTKMGSSPFGNSMDGYFQEKGKEYQKEVKGLETVDDQLNALFGGYTLQRQVDMLLEMVYDKNGQSTDEVQQLTEMYNQQNLQGLLELMQKNTTPEELENLLIKRNKNWIPQIDTLFKQQKSVFIAVGAGHLPGEFGVLNLLLQKGYRIEPIEIKIQ